MCILREEANQAPVDLHRKTWETILLRLELLLMADVICSDTQMLEKIDAIGCITGAQPKVGAILYHLGARVRCGRYGG